VSDTAAAVVRRLTERGQTVGCAESLTGGLLCGALTSVPGASATVVGGVVAYWTGAKAALLGVDDDLLARAGAVDPEVARQMAIGVCRVLACDWGVATTGVAGPDEQDGKPVGTVFVAVAGPGHAEAVSLQLTGDRPAIREAAVGAALRLLETRLKAPQRTGVASGEDPAPGRR
jgi:nicotinamide-nucleotide amidase